MFHNIFRISLFIFLFFHMERGRCPDFSSEAAPLWAYNLTLLFSHQLLRLLRDAVPARSTPAAAVIIRSHFAMSVSSPVFGASFCASV